MTCGMPFVGGHENDIALRTDEGAVCVFDAENGVMKSPEAIFAGGVEFFAKEAAGGDRALAERLTRTNMKSLPHWQKNPFALLDGEEATEQEFQACMAKL